MAALIQPPEKETNVTPQELLTPAETAAILRVSLGTLANWRTRHPCPLPFVKLGRLVRYRRDDVDGFSGLGGEVTDDGLEVIAAGAKGSVSSAQITPAGR